METSTLAAESHNAMGFQSDGISSGLMPSDDQYFLLYFIVGTYFGPDLRGERPQKSVLQRLAEGLPQYTSNHLTGSQMKTVEVEKVYYYVLKKSDQSVTVKLPWLQQFFHGHLPVPASYPQFPDLFPPQLHPLTRYRNQYKTIDNIVFINHPEIFYIKPEDILRFKRLTGLENFLLDRDGARFHTSVDGEALYNVAVQEDESNGEFPYPRSSRGSQRTRHIDDILSPKDLLQCVNDVNPVHSLPYNGRPTTYSCMAPLPAEVGARFVEGFGPRMIFLPSYPTMEEWEDILIANKSGTALSGSAGMGQFGPVIGLVDIGECEDSYLFRVSLPGVKRDERYFSCEVENDGIVLIRGLTTSGERTVYRYSQVFEMQSQNLSPPGDFSVSFKLPGPVNPRQFSGNFGTDGILEGIVMKGK